MKRVGLFGKFGRVHVREMIESRARLLEGRYAVEKYDFDSTLPERVDVDLAVVFGGDGTILQAARYLAPQGIPAIGVNLGKFGFLAGCTAEACPDLVDQAFAGTLQAIDRTMLSGRLCRKEQTSETMTALNEIVVTASQPTRMIGISIRINGAAVSSFQGDGIIIASATGSTGYTLSSGGPIVSPEEDVIILTALAPHTLAIRPLVTSGGHTVDVEVAARKGDVAVTADGQVAATIRSGDCLTVARAPFTFRLYEGPDWNFYQVVRSKLRWGEEPNYAKSHH